MGLIPVNAKIIFLKQQHNFVSNISEKDFTDETVLEESIRLLSTLLLLCNLR